MRKLSVRVENKAVSKLERLAVENDLTVAEYVRDVINAHLIQADVETDFRELKNDTQQTLAQLRDEITRLRTDMTKAANEQKERLEMGIAHELDVHKGETKKFMEELLRVIATSRFSQSDMSQGFPDYMKTPSSNPNR